MNCLSTNYMLMAGHCLTRNPSGNLSGFHQVLQGKSKLLLEPIRKPFQEPFREPLRKPFRLADGSFSARNYGMNRLVEWFIGHSDYLSLINWIYLLWIACLIHLFKLPFWLIFLHYLFRSPFFKCRLNVKCNYILKLHLWNYHLKLPVQITSLNYQFDLPV